MKSYEGILLLNFPTVWAQICVNSLRNGGFWGLLQWHQGQGQPWPDRQIPSGKHDASILLGDHAGIQLSEQAHIIWSQDRIIVYIMVPFLSPYILYRQSNGSPKVLGI